MVGLAPEEAPGSRPSRGGQAERLGRAAADWLVSGDRAEAQDLSMYHGRAGVLLALVEAHGHLGDERYAVAAARSADDLSAGLSDVADSSLYFGLTGVAVALPDGTQKRTEHCAWCAGAATRGSDGARCSSCCAATPVSPSARCRPATSISRSRP